MAKIENEVNVVAVQYNPKYKDPSYNMVFLNNLLDKYSKDDKIDLIVFPEMTLPGYIFTSKEDIAPFIDEYNKGPTYDFCSSLSKRLNCYVFLGYGERLNDHLYNSCLITNREGEALPSYHKTFLYENDKTWCEEGDGFGYIEIMSLQGKLIKIGIGICMDINPYEFKSPWEKMEFSTHCYDKDVDIIVFLTNWIDQEPELQTNKEIMKMLNYWAARLEPFFKKGITKNKYFIAADRTGKEFDTNFIGCSCILQITPKPTLIAMLNKIEEKTIFGKLKFDQ